MKESEENTGETGFSKMSKHKFSNLNMFSVVHAKNRSHKMWQGVITEVTAHIAAGQQLQ